MMMHVTLRGDKICEDMLNFSAFGVDRQICDLL